MENEKNSNKHKNPSRKECEKIIRRILITEILENGRNKHFRMATDFISYFQSLYPASDSLTKQVQRAVKSMDMPKDAEGFFIIDRTSDQMEQDKDLSRLFQSASSELVSLEECETLFITADEKYRSYLIFQINQSVSFKDRFVTIMETCNGLIFYTRDKVRLTQALKRLLS